MAFDDAVDDLDRELLGYEAWLEEGALDASGTTGAAEATQAAGAAWLSPASAVGLAGCFGAFPG